MSEKSFFHGFHKQTDLFFVEAKDRSVAVYLLCRKRYALDVCGYLYEQDLEKSALELNDGMIRNMKREVTHIRKLLIQRYGSEQAKILSQSPKWLQTMVYMNQLFILNLPSKRQSLPQVLCRAGEKAARPPEPGGRQLFAGPIRFCRRPFRQGGKRLFCCNGLRRRLCGILGSPGATAIRASNGARMYAQGYTAEAVVPIAGRSFHRQGKLKRI